MRPASRRRLWLGLGFTAYFVALWYLWYTPVVYPLKIFVVLLHELSHALALWATGGSVESITLDPRQGGLTIGRGGIAFVTLSAGYLGSLLFGALLVLAARARKLRAGALLGGIGIAVLLLTAFYIRNAFGITFGVLTGLALLGGAQRLPAHWSVRLVTALGLTSVGYAILDIKSDILDRPELQSDAAMLAEMTGIPTLVWGIAWITIALWIAFLLLRHTLSRA